MTDNVFSDMQPEHAPDDEDIVTADRDISHLLPYLSLQKEAFLEMETDWDRLFEQFGISSEEMKHILKDSNIILQT